MSLHRLLAVSASLTFALAGCSPAPDSAIEADSSLDQAASAPEGTSSGDITVLTERTTLGEGRGRQASTTADGSTLAVATSLGLHFYGADGSSLGAAGTELDDAASHLTAAPDAPLVAVARERVGDVQIWDAAMRSMVVDGRLPVEGNLLALTLLPESAGLLIATDAGASVRDIEPGLPVRYTIEAEGTVGPTALSADGAWIDVANRTEAESWIARHEPASGAEIGRLPVPDGGQVESMVTSPDGSSVAAVVGLVPRSAPQLVVWATAAPDSPTTLDLDAAAPALGFTGDGAALLVAEGAAIDVLRIADLTWLDPQTGTGSGSATIAAVPGSGDAVTTHPSGDIVLWSGSALEPTTVGRAAGRIVDTRVSADGQTVTTVSFAGNVELWSLTEPAATVRVDRHARGEITDVAYSDGGDTLLSATSTGKVDVVDVDAGDLVQSFDLGLGKVDGVALGPDDDTLIAGVGERTGELAYDDTVAYWSLGSGNVVHRSGGDRADVVGCSFFRNRVKLNPDRSMVAVNSHDFTVELRDLDGDLLHVFDGHANSVLDFAFSPDGALFATASDDGKVRVWTLADRRLIAEHATLGGQWTIVFGADSRRLVAGDLSGDIRVLDLDSGEWGPAFGSRKNRVSTLALSPDGAMVAGGDSNNNVVVWNTADGAVVARGEGHTAPVLTVAFAPDGQTLTSGSRDYTMRVWAL